MYVNWRGEIPYQPTIQSHICSINALSPQPETVQNLHLLMPINIQLHSIITMTIGWNIPIFNGQFLKYQICLNNEILTENDYDPFNCKDVSEVRD